MAVPAEIRAVPRPKNTVVDVNSRPGPKQYPVRERSHVKYVRGGNPQPVNGRVIGHIVDGRFEPLKRKAADKGPEMLSYGSAALVHSEVGDIADDLYAIMDVTDAQRIIAIACLRIIDPGIALRRYSVIYNMTFMREFYPGLGLSAGVVENLQKRLGMDTSMRIDFFNRRFAKILDTHTIAIDGTLKQDTSTINSLSEFSYKARIKGCRDISVLYAYDVDIKEPICAQVFPGNSIDAVSYREFIRTNNITKGIIIADKGFPPSKIADELKDNKDLHFITPIKNNDKRIEQYDMIHPTTVITGFEKTIICKKQALPDGHFLYSFFDGKRHTAECNRRLDQIKREEVAETELLQKLDRLGLIVFESDSDLAPRDIYLSYKDRWKIELVFRYYKNNVDFDKTRVQDDFAVIGSEFINFIASIITCRIIERMRKAGVLEKDSYKDVMKDLYSVSRNVSHAENPVENDQYWSHTIKCAMQKMVALGLAKPEGQENKSINNEGGNQNDKTAAVATSTAEAGKKGSSSQTKSDKTADVVASAIDTAKTIGKATSPATTEIDTSKDGATVIAPKRGRGRPRKHPLPDPNQPKRKRGRPRVHPIIMDHPKRRRGRPRKTPQEI